MSFIQRNLKVKLTFLELIFSNDSDLNRNRFLSIKKKNSLSCSVLVLYRNFNDLMIPCHRNR